MGSVSNNLGPWWHSDNPKASAPRPQNKNLRGASECGTSITRPVAGVKTSDILVRVGKQPAKPGQGFDSQSNLCPQAQTSTTSLRGSGHFGQATSNGSGFKPHPGQNFAATANGPEHPAQIPCCVLTAESLVFMFPPRLSPARPAPKHHPKELCRLSSRCFRPAQDGIHGPL